MANENGDLQHNNEISVSVAKSSLVQQEEGVLLLEQIGEILNQNDENAAATEQANTAAARMQGASKDVDLNATDGASGNINDLVADLCLNNVKEREEQRGADYELSNINANKQPEEASLEAVGSNQQTPIMQQTTQNASSFSFKHFLSSNCNTMTPPSSTITSLDSLLNATNANSSTSSGAATSTASLNALQTSTGTRPKVPQSASAYATSISSLLGGHSAGDGGQDASSASTKMKRSPRFSSFDSQASLAEYTNASSSSGCELEQQAAVGAASTGFRLCLDAASRDENRDIFATRSSGNARPTNLAGDSSATASFDGANVSRSHSNYEMPRYSPRRRMGISSGTRETRPTRLALNTNSAKLKLDLPLDSAGNNAGNATRTLPSNATDYQPAAAAALPDFVQDHWMDSWYAHEMHLNSPPNSPIAFKESINCAQRFELDAAGAGAVGGIAPSAARATGGGGGVGSPGINISAAGAAAQSSDTSNSSKMLPDFLSDGLNIHSSQRMADVAAGLPSNTMTGGSPEDTPMTSKLSTLRIENERLQRELSDARAALNEQTRRANELERKCQELQRSEDANNRARSQNHVTQVEENLHKSKRHTAAAQGHVVQLKQQVTQLTTEVEKLRRENETLREEGAVGGYKTSNCDASMGATAAASNRRPSRKQQISRDLRSAASTAENNLRQLLAGVENLRQMAADIESSELRAECNATNRDPFTEFLDECDDYDDFAGGGPAL